MNKKTNRLHSSQKNAMLRARNREQIRLYFEQVLNLQNSGEAYPVKLDDVWPLVYSFKKDAVDVLKSEFYSDIDYIVQSPDYQRLGQNPQNLRVGGDFRSQHYYLTASCMEYFVARRVPEVFEVYRKVFHLHAQSMKSIAGVMPILYNGNIYYPYNKLLRAIGYSGRSGSVSKRKRQYPKCFMKDFGINFITTDMAQLLTEQRKLFVTMQDLRLRQMELIFSE